jgi:hypothetical protein
MKFEQVAGISGFFRKKRGGEGGHTVAQLFEVLRYKPEGRDFDSRWCH